MTSWAGASDEDSHRMPTGRLADARPAWMRTGYFLGFMAPKADPKMTAASTEPVTTTAATIVAPPITCTRGLWPTRTYGNTTAAKRPPERMAFPAIRSLRRREAGYLTVAFVGSAACTTDWPVTVTVPGSKRKRVAPWRPLITGDCSTPGRTHRGAITEFHTILERASLRRCLARVDHHPWDLTAVSLCLRLFHAAQAG